MVVGGLETLLTGGAECLCGGTLCAYTTDVLGCHWGLEIGVLPGLVVGTVCPVFALTIGVATVDLGAEILATAAAPRGTWYVAGILTACCVNVACVCGWFCLSTVFNIPGDIIFTVGPIEHNVVVILLASIDEVAPEGVTGFIRDSLGFMSSDTDLPTKLPGAPTDPTIVWIG